MAKVGKILPNYIHKFPQEAGDSISVNIGDTVALYSDGIDIIVSSKRSQCYSPSIFDDFDVSMDEEKIVVVKSMQHFYAGFSKISRNIIYMSGPGAVPPNVAMIKYQRLSFQKMYPWFELAV